MDPSWAPPWCQQISIPLVHCSGGNIHNSHVVRTSCRCLKYRSLVFTCNVAFLGGREFSSLSTTSTTWLIRCWMTNNRKKKKERILTPPSITVVVSTTGGWTGKKKNENLRMIERKLVLQRCAAIENERREEVRETERELDWARKKGTFMSPKIGRTRRSWKTPTCQRQHSISILHS